MTRNRSLAAVTIALALQAPLLAARAQDVPSPEEAAARQSAPEPYAPDDAAQEAAVDPTLRDVHLALQIGTAASLALTASLGVIAALNEQTLFGSGECLDPQGDPIFGYDYGCEEIGIVHGMAGVTTTILYTGAIVTGAMMPEHGRAGTLYDVLTAIHVAGMFILPIAGLLSVYPDVLGISPDSQQDFSKIGRTIHIVGAATTALAYGTTLVLDWM